MASLPQSEHSVDLAALCTILITTSPLRSNPSTELLERVYSGFGRKFRGAELCPKVISCDGYVLDDDAPLRSKV